MNFVPFAIDGAAVAATKEIHSQFGHAQLIHFKAHHHLDPTDYLVTRIIGE